MVNSVFFLTPILHSVPDFLSYVFPPVITLSSSPISARFMSGKEVKKKKHLFGLRIRFPPAPPNSDEPVSIVMERASHEITIKGCKSTKGISGMR